TVREDGSSDPADQLRGLVKLLTPLTPLTLLTPFDCRLVPSYVIGVKRVKRPGAPAAVCNRRTARRPAPGPTGPPSAEPGYSVRSDRPARPPRPDPRARPGPARAAWRTRGKRPFRSRGRFAALG